MSTQPDSPRRPRGSRARRLVAVLGAICAAVLITACGNQNDRQTTGTYAGNGGFGAPYLSVGKLVYQVQISRELNQYEIEDKQFMEGLTPEEAKLHPGEEWFGVFVQVYNETGSPHRATGNITVYDTEGNVYHPIIPNETNLYAYRPEEVVPANGQIPVPNSTADSTPIGGLVLLYKIKVESIENRPLEIKIVSQKNPSEVATAELDV